MKFCSLLLSQLNATHWLMNMCRMGSWALLLAACWARGALAEVEVEAEGAAFNPTCRRDAYNLVPSNSSLPAPASTDEVLHSLLSDSGSGSDSASGGKLKLKQEAFLAMYRKGLQECEEFAGRSSGGDSRGDHFEPKQMLNEPGSSLYRGCRGRKLLRSLTGLVLWPFGPISSCPTHSSCWFGLLHCGNFSAARLASVTERWGVGERKWSLGALHVDMSLLGPEILTPRSRLVRLPGGSGGASSQEGVEVIVADYTLTVAGDYRLLLDLQGLYPSVLLPAVVAPAATPLMRRLRNKDILVPIIKHNRSSNRKPILLSSSKHPAHMLSGKSQSKNLESSGKSPLAVFGGETKSATGEEKTQGGQQLRIDNSQNSQSRSTSNAYYPTTTLDSRTRYDATTLTRRSLAVKRGSTTTFSFLGGEGGAQKKTKNTPGTSILSSSASPSFTSQLTSRSGGSGSSSSSSGSVNSGSGRKRPLLRKRKGKGGGQTYHHSSSSRTERNELVPSIFLGDCEIRVNSGRQYYCLAECATAGYVAGSPFLVHATDASARCSTEHSPQSLHVSPLPLCTSGDHAGRYLQLPNALVQLCGGQKFTALYQQEQKAQQGKRQYFDRYAAIQKKYLDHANTLQLKKKKVMSIMQDSLSASHFRELQQYITGEDNFCLLVDITLLDAETEGEMEPAPRAEVYAPYQCRYHLFSAQQASQCFRAQGYSRLLFHGDSMMRAVYGSFTRTFGTSILSEAELKELTNIKKQDEIFSEVGGVTVMEKYTWEFRDDALGSMSARHQQFPDVFFVNFAFAHSLSVDLHALDTYMRNTHETVKFIEKHYFNGNNRSKSRPRLAIYQSASAMHGKRNLGFHWMSEVVRRQNAQLRSLLVDELAFLNFDEYLLTSAYFGKTGGRDGWHYNGSNAQQCPDLNEYDVRE